jgi:hypothetical protein
MILALLLIVVLSNFYDYFNELFDRRSTPSIFFGKPSQPITSCRVTSLHLNHTVTQQRVPSREKKAGLFCPNSDDNLHREQYIVNSTTLYPSGIVRFVTSMLRSHYLTHYTALFTILCRTECLQNNGCALQQSRCIQVADLFQNIWCHKRLALCSGILAARVERNGTLFIKDSRSALPPWWNSASIRLL